MSTILCTLFGIWCHTYEYGWAFDVMCFDHASGWMRNKHGELTSMEYPGGWRHFFPYGSGMFLNDKFVAVSVEPGKCLTYKFGPARVVDRFDIEFLQADADH